MNSPLDNPFRSLRSDEGEAPPWLWRMAGMLSGILAATLLREVIDRSRSRVSGRAAAAVGKGSDKPDSWVSALFWAGVIGVTGALGRMVAQRAIATAWTRRVALRRS